eukprot:TRINITY_DN2299_c0_g1_i10.p1 TRINITY_DN2299_c0_g1~~TRINITY_DN2299_c0_g1_i10.p1  ORF type:complete len:232 (-),score=54.17 TRINITY_DN2299_c0_g1_i10:696-1391(-)
MGCVFVKTSCRSAKDTTLYNANFKKAYSTFLEQKSEKDSLNSQVCALLEAGCEALKTYDSNSLFSTFLISSRVYQDFELALLRKERWNQSLVVRKWKPIAVDMEFRGFVKNSRITALSQYNYVAFFPKLVSLKDKIEQMIVSFFYNSCLPALNGKYNEFIIDFGIVGESLDEIVVIELNEFMDTTDGCLFHWTNERHLLENEPLTFRIQETEIPPSLQLGFLSVEWRMLLH